MRKSSISLEQWCLQNGKDVLLKEWDYERNDILPSDISRASKKNVYWKCVECGESFTMPIQRRTLTGAKCQKCACKYSREKGRITKLKKSGSLAETNKKLLEKWNYEKNTDITPYDVSRHSTTKVWWKCQVCGNEFKSSVADVRCENGCIKCKGNKYYELGKDGKYAIYCHICPDEKRYIGMTSMRLCKRFANGSNYSVNCRFGKAIEKFGWENIKHEVLEKGLSKEEAWVREKYYIKLYRTTEEEFGYNMADGGNISVSKGRILSEETKKKISDSNKGKKRTKETIEKLKASHIGQESHNIRSVIKMDLDGNELKVYISMAEAVRMNERVSQTSIWRCCTGRRKTAGGYKWKYK